MKITGIVENYFLCKESGNIWSVLFKCMQNPVCLALVNLLNGFSKAYENAF